MGGPRQVGKTQLRKMIIPDPAAYLNFDTAERRTAILKGELMRSRRSRFGPRQVPADYALLYQEMVLSSVSVSFPLPECCA